MKKYITYFIFISIAFLIFALIKADYLIIPNIVSPGNLIISFIILFIGFLFDNLSWHRTLRAMGKPISFKNAIISGGLSVFGKYIPGKVWTIAGRSAYVAKEYNYNEKETVNISLQAEIISIWTGFILGSFALFLLENPGIMLVFSLGMVVFLGLVILWDLPHALFTRLLKLIFKKEFNFPLIELKQVLIIMPWFIIKWFLFGFSFWFLSKGLAIIDFPWYLGMCFPLAGTIGIISIIMPGGIGVREGIISWYLSSIGLGIAISATIGVASRLWFLSGELFIFLLSIIMRFTKKRSSDDSKPEP
ncbi:MAG: lysylphosphatidylglycerol synthase domain-containing protein [Bacteroidota bacterium]|nr:lysylphosphatidylglycerol synthase domain-containing protein [Bacteroidota bacterium]